MKRALSQARLVRTGARRLCSVTSATSAQNLLDFVAPRCKPRAGRSPPISGKAVAEAIAAIESSALPPTDRAEAEYCVGVAFLSPGSGEPRMEVQRDPESGRYRYRPTADSAKDDGQGGTDAEQGPAPRRKHLDDGANQVMAEIFEQRKIAVVAKRGGESVEERADRINAARGEPSIKIPDHPEACPRPLVDPEASPHSFPAGDSLAHPER